MAVLSALLSVLAAIEGDGRTSWNLRDHIPLEEVAVQSPSRARGADAGKFDRGVRTGVEAGTIPEADLRMSRDGVIFSSDDGAYQGNAIQEM
jgi:glycerophosphoryl diester phosphodiesterase